MPRKLCFLPFAGASHMRGCSGRCRKGVLSGSSARSPLGVEMTRKVGAALLAFAVSLAGSPCAARTETGGSARGGAGGLSLGFNFGADIPPGSYTFGYGGVWHVVAGLPVSRSLSLAFEIGTAANKIENGRSIVLGGVPRKSSIHAVSTLGIIARRSLGHSKLHPYFAIGANWYTEWDEITAPATQPAASPFRAGPGIQGGVGSALWLGSRWDVLGEGVYHFALDSGHEARFMMLRSGLRYYFGHRSRSR